MITGLASLPGIEIWAVTLILAGVLANLYFNVVSNKRQVKVKVQTKELSNQRRKR